MGWTARIGLALVVLIILAVGGLAIYAGRLEPPHRTYRQVIPDDRFRN